MLTNICPFFVTDLTFFFQLFLVNFYLSWLGAWLSFSILCYHKCPKSRVIYNLRFIIPNLLHFSIATHIFSSFPSVFILFYDSMFPCVFFFSLLPDLLFLLILVSDFIFPSCIYSPPSRLTAFLVLFLLFYGIFFSFQFGFRFFLFSNPTDSFFPYPVGVSFFHSSLHGWMLLFSFFPSVVMASLFFLSILFSLWYTDLPYFVFP